MRDIQQEVLRALPDRLPLYLCGYGEYYISYSEFIPSYQPTDMDVVFLCGIYPAYSADNGVKDAFEAALVTLAGKGAFETYCAAYYLLHQCINEAENTSPFRIAKEPAVSAIREGILRNGDELKRGIRDYHGETHSGAWDDIQRWNNTLNRHFSLSIL